MAKPFDCLPRVWYTCLSSHYCNRHDHTIRNYLYSAMFPHYLELIHQAKIQVLLWYWPLLAISSISCRIHYVEVFRCQYLQMPSSDFLKALHFGWSYCKPFFYSSLCRVAEEATLWTFLIRNRHCIYVKIFKNGRK